MDELLGAFAEALSRHTKAGGGINGDTARAAAAVGQSAAWGKRALKRLIDDLGAPGQTV